MSEFNGQAHWQQVYKEKGEYQVSWFQDQPAISLELIKLSAQNQARPLSTSAAELPG